MTDRPVPNIEASALDDTRSLKNYIRKGFNRAIFPAKWLLSFRSAELRMPRRAYLWFLLEVLLFLSGLVFLASLTLLVALGIGVAAYLRPKVQDLPHLFLLVLYLAFLGRMIKAIWVDVVPLIFGVLEELTTRLVIVLVIGWSEMLNQSKTWIWGRYVGVGVLSTFFAYRFCIYAVPGAIPEIAGAIGPQHETHIHVWALTSSLLSVATAVYLTAIPMRMLFSTRLQALLERGEFMRAGVVVLGPYGDVAQASLREKSAILISQISDLHIGGVENETEASSEEERLARHERGLARLLRQIQACRPQAIVISGDITDRGSEQQWGTFQRAVQASGAASLIVMAPGNHDLNIVFDKTRETLAKFEQVNRRGDNERALSYLQAATTVMGSRTRVVSPFTGAIASLSEVFERAAVDFHHWKAGTGPADTLSPVAVLEQIFPMVVTVQDGMSVFVWNTVKRNRWPVFNSVGAVQAGQVERASLLSRALSASEAILHVAHHQVSVPSRRERRAVRSDLPLSRWITSKFMSIEDSSLLLKWFRSRRQKAVLLHGHHHKFFLRQTVDRSLIVVSAPSATVGCEESFDDACSADKRGKWLEVDLLRDGPDLSVDLVRVRQV